MNLTLRIRRKREEVQISVARSDILAGD
jgi:hypothetical protein